MRQIILIALAALLIGVGAVAGRDTSTSTAPHDAAPALDATVDLDATISALQTENDALRATLAALSPTGDEARFYDSFDDNSHQWALLPDVRIQDGWLIVGDRAEAIMIPDAQLPEFYADFMMQYDASARPYLCFGADGCEYRILMTTIPTGLVDEPSMQVRLYHNGSPLRDSDPLIAPGAGALYHVGILYTGGEVEISMNGEPVVFQRIAETSDPMEIGLGSFLGQIVVDEIRVYDSRPAY
jgi:hypothetical protein